LKNFLTRALTGIIYATTIVAAICIHPYAFLVFFAIIVGLALWEFYELVKENKVQHKLIAIASGIYLFMASFFYAGGFASSYIFYPYIIFLLALLISSLYNNSPNPIGNCAMTFFAHFYCAGLLSTLNFIVFDPTTKLYYPYFAFLIFIFVWLNDTGAYLTGITFGKHHLFQRISPKKSWEGFWGGFMIVVLSSQAIAYFFPEVINWHHSLVLGILTVIFSTWGDLVESLLKRSGGVKDSGTLLPGHGGILDRFDSIILTTPAIFIYIELFIRN
jgi:CDP-diglyceride synthetase